MSEALFDVQAAMLYNAAPSVDASWLQDQMTRQAMLHGLPGPIKILPGLTSDCEFSLSGCGVHVMISIRAEPLAQDAFTMQLSTPIRKLKTCDFEGIIETHRQAVVINVGDGETPVPLDVRKMMVDAGITAAADPIVKLTVLHLAIQAIASLQAPLMTDFLPSQSLLAPEELSAVADMGLPIPILVHPYPVDGGEDAEGNVRFGMLAIHSQLLIGHVLELEAVPEGVDVGTMINLLASLISEHRSGTLPLDHGDVLQEPGGIALYIRHEAPENSGEPPRIIASFDTPASESAPVLMNLEPEAPVESTDEAQQAFQTRVAKLKAKAVPEGMPVPDAHEQNTDAVQGSAAPLLSAQLRKGFPVPPSALKIGAAAVMLGAVYLFNPSALIGNRIEAELQDQQVFQDAMGAGGMSSMRTASNQYTEPATTPSQGDTIVRTLRSPADIARVTSLQAPNQTNGQLVITGTDADGNPVVFERTIVDDAERTDIIREAVEGQLRSQITRPAD